MLVHMTPNEVNSLQGLAMAAGGSLTINPHTGLPEAGFLSSLLPTLVGLGLTVASGGALSPLMAAGITGAGTAALTGDLKQGFMAGLGAYGGASLGGALGAGNLLGSGADKLVAGGTENLLTNAVGEGVAGGVADTAASGVVGSAPGAVPGGVTGGFIPSPETIATEGFGGSLPNVTGGGLSNIYPDIYGDAGSVFGLESTGAPSMAIDGVPLTTGGPMPWTGADALNSVYDTAALVPPPPEYAGGLKGFMRKFGDEAARGIGKRGMLTTGAAGLGLANSLSEAMQPKFKPPKEDKWNYEGPYVPEDREVSFPIDPRITRDSSEYMYFNPSNPVPGYRPYVGMAEGGSVSPSRVGEQNYGFAPMSNIAPASSSSPMAGVSSLEGLVQAMSQNGKGGKVVAPTGAPPPGYVSSATGMVTPTALPASAHRSAEQDYGFRPLWDPAGASSGGAGSGSYGGGVESGDVSGGGVAFNPYRRTDSLASRMPQLAAGGLASSPPGSFQMNNTMQTQQQSQPTQGSQFGQSQQRFGGPFGGVGSSFGFGGSGGGGRVTGAGGGYNSFGFNRNEGPARFMGSNNPFRPNTSQPSGFGGLGQQPTAPGGYSPSQPPNDVLMSMLNNGPMSMLENQSTEFPMGVRKPKEERDPVREAREQEDQESERTRPYADLRNQMTPFIENRDFQGLNNFIQTQLADPSNMDQWNSPFPNADEMRAEYADHPRVLERMNNQTGRLTGRLGPMLGNFGDLVPTPTPAPPEGGGMARGGEVGLKDGSFVVDARTVSELGNGSSSAGQEILSRLGGRAIRGAGDGVSDSIRANIGGRQEARVARDEVHFSPEAVNKLGGGNHSKGTKKLYALMKQAESARKKMKRGSDNKLRKKLGA